MMPFSHPDSSEESSLLESGGRIGGDSGSLRQPFMSGSYNSNGSTSSAKGASETPCADATTCPLQPAADEEEAQEMREEAVAEQDEEVPDEPIAPLTGTRLFIVSSLFVFTYLAVGVIVYMLLAGMPFLDALYFCVVTLTTVGYGDLSAHSPVTKLFACFYILIGVAMITAFLGQLVELVLDKQEDLIIKILKKTTEKATGSDPIIKASEKGETGAAVLDDIDDGNGNGNGNSGPSLGGQDMEVALGIFFFLMLVGVGTVVFKTSGHMSFIDAFYLTVVSSSTVGYGDYYPTNEWTRLFAIFFLPVSTLLLGKIITDYTEMKSRENAKHREKRILLATVSVKEYKDMDADGDNKVSPMEFMCSTLVKQGKVTQEELDEICCRFRVLDKDCNGYISLEEVSASRDRDGDGFITASEL